jgi:crotonobetainyl-CoA:carnitine CoA-transferase CaiB-like acyl-CoA transferase
MAVNPRLIHVSISGYGDSGPYRNMKAYDLLVQAEIGLCSVNGSADQPARVGVSVCDIAAGMYAHQAILQALIGRGITGQGRAIKVSLFDAMADWMNVPYLQSVYGGKVPARTGLHHPSIAPYGAYLCRGGDQLIISIQNEREWQRLCAMILGDAALAADERFSDGRRRVANRAALDVIVTEAFGRYGRDELARLLDEAQIGYGQVRGPLDLPAHPQSRFVTVETETGPVRLLAPPPIVGDETAPELGPVPRLGEHTEAARAEFR